MCVKEIIILLLIKWLMFVIGKGIREGKNNCLLILKWKVVDNLYGE